MDNRQFRFEVPMQVAFLDFDSDEICWIGGIAFGSNIICGCCGATFEIAELWADWDEFKENYPEVDSPIRVFENWVDINEEIKGVM